MAHATSATKSSSMQINENNQTEDRQQSLWIHAIKTLCSDKMAVFSIVIVFIYSVIAILSFFDLLASGWDREVGSSYMMPSAEHILGLDIFGRDVLKKVIKGTEVAMVIGLVSSLLSTFIGLSLGSLAGYFGGKVDDLIVWLYTTFSSIPWILLILGMALVMGKGLSSVIIALGLTTWVTLCRLVRAEVIRHKQREYVQAASSIGSGHLRKLYKHIIPNVFHVVIINFSLQFQTAIKAEVIISYLGFGVQDKPSWGVMINDAKLEIARDPAIWGGLIGSTIAMLFIVLAFNLLGDSLRDALDPKLKGR